MSFIYWSDSEEMFGLLVEYVADEYSEAEETRRRVFLSRLKEQLEALQEAFESLPPVDAIASLQAIRHSIPGEFETDSVVEHVIACVEELERIHATATT